MTAPAWIAVHIDFTDRRPDMHITIPNRSATEVAEYLARMLGTIVPATDIRLDLDQRSFRLRGAGTIEDEHRWVVATIQMRGAA